MKRMRHGFAVIMLLGSLMAVSHAIADSVPDAGCSELDRCIACSVCVGGVVHAEADVERPVTISLALPAHSSPCLEIFVEKPFQPPRV